MVIKEKAKGLLYKAEGKALEAKQLMGNAAEKSGPVASSLAAFGAGLLSMRAYADGISDARTLFKYALEIIAGLALVIGLMLFVIGAIQLAEANADDSGGGQKKEKAQGKIIAAILVAAVGAILLGAKVQLSDLIKNVTLQ